MDFRTGWTGLAMVGQAKPYKGIPNLPNSTICPIPTICPNPTICPKRFVNQRVVQFNNDFSIQRIFHSTENSYDFHSTISHIIIIRQRSHSTISHIVIRQRSHSTIFLISSKGALNPSDLTWGVVGAVERFLPSKVAKYIEGWFKSKR